MPMTFVARFWIRSLRHLVLLALGAAASAAMAQGFPSKPVTLVLPGPPGGSADAVARAIAEEMASAMGQAVIVDNRPGAAGTLGTAQVARAEPDGHTLLITAHFTVLNAPLMMAKLPYDVKRDLAFLSELSTSSLVLVVNKDVPARNLKEFIAWAAANRGKVNYGSFGVGSGAHLMGAYLSKSQHLDMTHVVYKGEAPMVQDLIGGQVQMALATPGTAMPHVASGRLRALAVAVAGDQRLPLYPELPTMAEAGLRDAEYRHLGGLVAMAPAKTPPAVLAELEKQVRAAVQSTPVKARMQVAGMVPLGNSSAEFRQRFDASLSAVDQMIRISGAKAE